MLRAAPWSTVDLTFHSQVAEASAEEVIQITNLALKANGQKVRAGAITGQVSAIDKKRLKLHYRANSVRPNSPQQELLVFGDVDSNEKRSIATVAKRVIWPGTQNNVLNMFIHDVAKCVGAQWRCDHEVSLDSRSKHFKSLVNDGVKQIPPDLPGVVHVLYETRDGTDVEQLRRGKNMFNISDYDASETTVLGVLVHAVNYYPFEDSYEVAETVEYFSRMPDLLSLFPRQRLMISCGGTNEVEDVTHWEQDRAAKSQKSRELMDNPLWERVDD